MKTEKKYLMYGIALILLTLIGVSLAYFVTEIVGSSKTISVSTGDLRIVFTDTDGSITDTNIEPGWNTTKTFSVENKTNSSYDYNIVIEDLVNTFSTTGYLVYRITSTDGGYSMEEYVDVPKSNTATDKVLAYSVTIPSKTTHNYTIEINYLNDEDNIQNIDMNSILSGNIYIGEGTEKPYTLAEAMLRDNSNISERTDFSVTNIANTTGTIYKTTSTEDNSIVYYYSGNTTNNWVKFGTYTRQWIRYRGYYSSTSTAYKEYDTIEECNTASSYNYNCGSYPYATVGDDMYWRIIRTNEDGSVRLMYAGTGHDTTSGYIGTSVFTEESDENRYVGYMYGGNTSLEDNRANTTDSTIKNNIDNWYRMNLLANYDKYISKDAIYCNDRSYDSGVYIWSNNGNKFYYGAYTRLSTNKTPTYKCGGNGNVGLFESIQAIQDKFSVSTTGGGNGNLDYGIALMTADEVAFAGGDESSALSSPYSWYYTNSNYDSITGDLEWWTITPRDGGGGYSSVFEVISSASPGSLDFGDTNYQCVVRPVISIDLCAKVTGTGTPEDPYVIDEQTSTC